MGGTRIQRVTDCCAYSCYKSLYTRPVHGFQRFFFWTVTKLKDFVCWVLLVPKETDNFTPKSSLWRNCLVFALTNCALGCICEDIFENIITELETCKAKSLYIKLTITRTSSKKKPGNNWLFVEFEKLITAGDIYSIFASRFGWNQRWEDFIEQTVKTGDCFTQ